MSDELHKNFASLLGFIAGTNASLQMANERAERERLLPSDYCPKCRMRMNRASKHKLVCPSCKQYKEI